MVAVPVALGEAAEAELVIPLTATAGGGALAAGDGDYTVSATALTFAAGESVAAVTVTAVADSLTEERRERDTGVGCAAGWVPGGDAGDGGGAARGPAWRSLGEKREGELRSGVVPGRRKAESVAVPVLLDTGTATGGGDSADGSVDGRGRGREWTTRCRRRR